MFNIPVYLEENYKMSQYNFKEFIFHFVNYVGSLHTEFHRADFKVKTSEIPLFKCPRRRARIPLFRVVFPPVIFNCFDRIFPGLFRMWDVRCSYSRSNTNEFPRIILNYEMRN